MRIPFFCQKSGLLSSQVAQARDRLFAEAGVPRAGALERWAVRLRTALNSPVGYTVILPLILLLHAVVLAPPAWPIVSNQTALSWIQTLWPVTIGLVSATFIIVFFVIQAVHRGEPHERVFDRFLMISDLRPIAALAFSTVFALGIASLLLTTQANEKTEWPEGASNLVYLDGALFTGVVLAAMRLYWVTFRFVRPGELLTLAISTAEKEIALSFERELEHRLSQGILDQRCAQMGLRYWSIGEPYARRGGEIRATASGEITEVSLNQIASAASQLRHTMGDGADQPHVKAHLYVALGSRVHRDDVLMRIPAQDYSESVAAKFSHALRIETPRPDDIDPGRWTDWVRDSAIRALDHGDSQAFERSLGAFERFLHSVRRTASGFGLVFTPEVVDRMLVGLEWRTLFLIQRAIEDIVRNAFRVGPSHLFLDALHWPINLAAAAADSRDFGAYRDALRLYPAIYIFSRRCDDEDKRSLGAGRAGLNLYQYGSFYLGAAFGDTSDAAELKRLLPYAREIVVDFGQLLKYAVNERDSEHFSDFVRNMASFPGIIPELPVYEFQRHALEAIEDSQVRDQQLREFDRRLALSSLVEEISLLRRAALIGVSSWAMLATSTGRAEAPLINSVTESVAPHFDSLKSLAHAMLAALDNDWEEPLGWSHWEFERQPRTREIEAISINTGDWLGLSYCLHGLRLTPSGESAPALPHGSSSQQLLDLATHGCQQLREHRDLWGGLLTHEDFDKEPLFLRLHQAAVERQQRDEEDRLIAQPVSQQKWDKFKGDLLREWAEAVTIRPLLASAGRVSYTSSSPPDDSSVKRLSWLQWLHKGTFVDNGTVLLPGTPGPSFARLEDDYIAEELRAHLPRKPNVTLEGLAGAITDEVADLRHQGFAPSLLLVSGKWQVDHQLTKSPSFAQPQERSGTLALPPGLHGWFDELPVVRIWQLDHDVITVLDASRVGSLEHFCPDNGKPFTCKLEEFATTEAVKALLHRAPNLRRDTRGRYRSTAAVTRELALRLHAAVTVGLRFNVTEPGAGVQIPVDIPAL